MEIGCSNGVGNLDGLNDSSGINWIQIRFSCCHGCSLSLCVAYLAWHVCMVCCVMCVWCVACMWFV